MPAEEVHVIDCAGNQLFGILHHADEPASDTGVVLVVGGPQYRVGSHRQFVLLARDLAAAGFPVLRFDYRGMGDSTGEPRDFEAIGDDIRCAVDCLFEQVPGMRGAVLWGLCDAATANAFHAVTDLRVTGQIALNPWVRTVEGEAQAYLKHYYLQRFLSRDFWRKLRSTDFDLRGSLRDLVDKLRSSRQRSVGTGDDRPLPERLQQAQRGFTGRTLVILSGQDLTAKEYESRVDEAAGWRHWLASESVQVQRLDEADHTFSRAAWRDQVAAWCRDWLADLARRDR